LANNSDLNVAHAMHFFRNGRIAWRRRAASGSRPARPPHWQSFGIGPDVALALRLAAANATTINNTVPLPSQCFRR
jgi:hypothetical protein